MNFELLLKFFLNLEAFYYFKIINVPQNNKIIFFYMKNKAAKVLATCLSNGQDQGL